MLLPEDFEHNPSNGDNGDEYYEVDDVVVGLVVNNLANNADEENQANREVLCLDKQVNLLYIIWGEEDPVGSLKSLQSEKEEHLIEGIVPVYVEGVAEDQACFNKEVQEDELGDGSAPGDHFGRHAHVEDSHQEYHEERK